MLPPAIHSFSEQWCHDNPHVTGYKHTTSLQGFALEKTQIGVTHTFFFFFFLKSPVSEMLYFVEDASSLPVNSTMWQQLFQLKWDKAKYEELNKGVDTTV